MPFPLTVTARDATGKRGDQLFRHRQDNQQRSGRSHFDQQLSIHATGAGNDNGVHTFNLTLKTAGTEIVQAIDTVSTNPIIQGSTKPITTNGLQVTAFNPTPTGFTATFNKTFLPADLTLYSQNKTTVMDVTLLGKNEGPIHGSLLIDPTNSIIIFNATASYLKELNANTNSPTVSAVLPDDTYTVTLVSGSGSNGFQDALGHLDGLSNNTHANFVTTFTTTYQTSATPALGIPDFARGPGGYTITSASENASNVVTMTTSIISNMQPGAQIVITNANPATYNGTYTILSTSSNTLTFNAPPGLGTYVGGGQANQDIQVLNDTNKGIPVTFYNANNVSDATFTLSFNPSLLQVTGAFGGTGSDASDQAAPATSFTLAGVNTIDATHAVASFTFHDATPQTGTVILETSWPSFPPRLSPSAPFPRPATRSLSPRQTQTHSCPAKPSPSTACPTRATTAMSTATFYLPSAPFSPPTSSPTIFLPPPTSPLPPAAWPASPLWGFISKRNCSNSPTSW